MAKKDITLEDALARIKELETQLDELTPKVSDQEKKIRERMAKGRLSYDVAKMAVEHQDAHDTQREADIQAKADREKKAKK